MGDHQCLVCGGLLIDALDPCSDTCSEECEQEYWERQTVLHAAEPIPAPKLKITDYDRVWVPGVPHKAHERLRVIESKSLDKVALVREDESTRWVEPDALASALEGWKVVSILCYP